MPIHSAGVRCIANTYIREEPLASLLGTVLNPVQISEEIAQDISKALQCSEADGERHRQKALRVLDQLLVKGTETGNWRRERDSNPR